MPLLMINVKTLLLLAIICIIAVSCARMFTSRNQNAAGALSAFATVGVDEFQALIADPSVQLLDVRSRDEFDEGHIAGAVLVDVNDSAFVHNAMALIDVSRPVAVYCRSGRRSARAASLLSAQGLTVTNLGGGVMDWQDAGKALVR